MSVLEDVGPVTIDLEGLCTVGDECGDFAARMHDQLSGAYDRHASTLRLPVDLGEHRTARKRAARATRLGYTFGEIERGEHADAIFEINTSAPERQGRPMSAGYQERVAYGPLPEYPCARHAISTYGVLDAGGTLRAYTWVYRVGALVMFSSILGHHDHLRKDVMFLLETEALRDQFEQAGSGVAFYNLHTSGTDGLRFHKERIGFRQTDVHWELG